MASLLQLSDVVTKSLWTGWLMFWVTLWPLALGFGISGLVQACAGRKGMEVTLGNHRPMAILRAAGFGMVSSSCSYAASAMSKSLIAKGADFITAMVFMVASTNLVIEIGLVMIALLGWQFAAAEFIGGPIMIVLLAWLGTTLFPGRLVRPAQQKLQRQLPRQDSDEQQKTSQKVTPLIQKLSHPSTWANAASYTLADLTMLRKELLIGFVIAGLLTTSVPETIWSTVFLKDQGIWTSVQNAFIGPLIALISFVCSVGNVAMAAALWVGGISFGGVIAFVFGDLITFPLLLIYRKYYGPRLALRMLIGLWLVMSISGLVVEGLFHGLGLIPKIHAHAGQTLSMSWNSTTWLNLLACAGLATGWWLVRNKERFGGGVGYAVDPMCGMQVECANAPATRSRHGTRYWFCSDHCAQRFDREGQNSLLQPSLQEVVLRQPATEIMKDPVCGMVVEESSSMVKRQHADSTVVFCGEHCAQHFDKNPESYVKNSKDPVCGMAVGVKAETPHRQRGIIHAWFCSEHCAEHFDHQLRS